MKPTNKSLLEENPLRSMLAERVPQNTCSGQDQGYIEGVDSSRVGLSKGASIACGQCGKHFSRQPAVVCVGAGSRRGSVAGG